MTCLLLSCPVVTPAPKPAKGKASVKPALVQEHVMAYLKAKYDTWFANLKGEWKPEQVQS